MGHKGPVYKAKVHRDRQGSNPNAKQSIKPYERNTPVSTPTYKQLLLRGSQSCTKARPEERSRFTSSVEPLRISALHAIQVVTEALGRLQTLQRHRQFIDLYVSQEGNVGYSDLPVRCMPLTNLRALDMYRWNSYTQYSDTLANE